MIEIIISQQADTLSSQHTKQKKEEIERRYKKDMEELNSLFGINTNQ